MRQIRDPKSALLWTWRRWYRHLAQEEAEALLPLLSTLSPADTDAAEAWRTMVRELTALSKDLGWTRWRGKWRRTEVLIQSGETVREQRQCSAPGCHRKHHAGGMCAKHYQHMRYHRPSTNPRKCHCGKPHWAKGLCKRHYIAAYPGDRASNPRRCDICGGPHHGHGLCAKHLMARKRRLKNPSLAPDVMS